MNMFGKWYEITWQITSDCNLRCPFCNVPQRYKSKAKPSLYHMERFIDYISESLRNIRYRRLFWSGGEPTLCKELFYLTRIARQKGWKVGMVTNGILLDRLSTQIATSGIDLIMVSVDGSNALIHDIHRGPGTFNKVIKGIRRLRETCGSDVKIGFSTLITSYNLSDIANIIDLGARLGIDLICIRPVLVNNNSPFALHITPTLMKELRTIVENKAKEYEGIIKMQVTDLYWKQVEKLLLNRATEEPMKCFSGVYFFHITPTGHIFPCWMTDSLKSTITINNVMRLHPDSFVKYLRNYFNIFIRRINPIIRPCNRCLVFYNIVANEGCSDMLFM